MAVFAAVPRGVSGNCINQSSLSYKESLSKLLEFLQCVLDNVRMSAIWGNQSSLSYDLPGN